MPKDVIFQNLPAGYAESSAKTGDEITVSTMEFSSSEDGDHFVNRLEGFPAQILEMVPELGILPSSVDHMLALVRKDRTATIYVNELDVHAFIQTKRSITAGEEVRKSDISDVSEIRFQDVNIPEDAGVIYLFSVAWRKGLYYDLQPIQHGESRPRNYDIRKRFGQLYAYLLFQDRFKIPEQAWETMLKQGYFPFISLSHARVTEVLKYANEQWSIDEILPAISKEVRGRLSQWLDKWRCNDYFVEHIEFLETAVDRFLENDYMSTVAILYPKIEGVLRSHHLSTSSEIRMTQDALVDSTFCGVDAEVAPKILLLPEYFRRYLQEVYFASFDPKEPKGLSRNTVSHGVAGQEDFDEKGAVLGFLVLDQLSFYLAGAQRPDDSVSTDNQNDE